MLTRLFINLLTQLKMSHDEFEKELEEFLETLNIHHKDLNACFMDHLAKGKILRLFEAECVRRERLVKAQVVETVDSLIDHYLPPYLKHEEAEAASDYNDSLPELNRLERPLENLQIRKDIFHSTWKGLKRELLTQKHHE